jgi:aryl-alcohol dehydrogenase-like predicted oxidoreductase
MELRRLGRSDLRLAPIVFGGNVLGWTVDQANAFRILDAFVDAGFNAIDTADSYSRWIPGHKGGESETIIGNWLKQGGGRRDKVLILTKVGSEMGGDKKGLSRRYILAEVEESLKRLGIDTIDLYQSHRDDPETPVLETIETYAELIKQGKVRTIGCSNFTAARMQESFAASGARGLPRYECAQPGYNLYARADYERELEPLCVKEQAGVIPYYALASGFLTGKYRSAADFGKSQRGGRMSAFLNPRGMKILGALDEVAGNRGVSLAAVALAWLIARPSITAPITSVTSVEQLKDFTSAVSLNLTPTEVATLDAASAY